MAAELDEVTLVVGRLEGAGGLNSVLRHQYFRRTGVHSSSSASRGATAAALERASSLCSPRVGIGGRIECSGRSADG